VSIKIEQANDIVPADQPNCRDKGTRKTPNEVLIPEIRALTKKETARITHA
jgi:hypothetical protein